MELDSRADVLDLRQVSKFTHNTAPNFIRRMEDKGKKYSFYELLSRKNSRPGSQMLFQQEPDDLDTKHKTLGMFRKDSLTRILCTVFYESRLQQAITAAVISVFVFASPFVDMQTLKSRSSSLVYFSRQSVLGILYSTHIWFFLRCIISSLL